MDKEMIELESIVDGKIAARSAIPYSRMPILYEWIEDVSDEYDEDEPGDGDGEDDDEDNGGKEYTLAYLENAKEGGAPSVSFLLVGTKATVELCTIPSKAEKPLAAKAAKKDGATAKAVRKDGATAKEKEKEEPARQTA